MLESQEIIIYSVNINNYDNFLLDKSISRIFNFNLNLKYYLFTDNIIHIPNYPFLEQVLITKNPKNNIYTINLKSNKKIIKIPSGIAIDRFIKLNPIDVLPKHNISIYHDARIILYPPIIEEISKFNLNFDLISLKHRFRRTFEEELLICFAYRKIDLKKYLKIINFANNSSFNTKVNNSIRLSENGLIVRKNNDKINIFSKKWTNLTIMTIRDQLSLPLTLYKLNDLNLERSFFKENFSLTKIAEVRNRKNNYSNFINFIKKSNFSLRYIFIYIFNYSIKLSLKRKAFLLKIFKKKII